MTELAPARGLAEIALGRQRSPSNAEGEHMVPYLRSANVKDGSLSLTDVKEMNFDPSEQEVFSLQPGDVLISEGAGSLAAVGTSAVYCGEIEGTVCFQNTLLRLRTRPGNDPRFVAWWARAAYDAGQFAAIATGASIYHLGAERVRSMRAWIPPLGSQRRIAAFLDAETERIDELITLKIATIRLLREREMGLVHQTIMGGLACGVPPVDTGLAFVPSLPSHWSVTRTRYVCDVGTGTGDTINAVEDGQYPFFIRSQGVMRSDDFLRDGEAVLTSGDGAGVGRDFHYWPGGPFQAHQRVYILDNFRLVSGRFFHYVFRSLFPIAALDGSAKATFDSVRRSMITDLPCPLPPEYEQRQIVDYLDQRLLASDGVITTLTRQIELLGERRRSLITAAVTGEMEVA